MWNRPPFAETEILPLCLFTIASILWVPIELPEYKVPSLKLAFGSMLERGKAYIIKAGTIILVCNTAVQIMQSFDTHFAVVEEGMENTSILAAIAAPFSYLLVPVVGFAAWQLAAAAITGFIAKENVVGTLAVCYGITNFIDTEELELVSDWNTYYYRKPWCRVCRWTYRCDYLCCCYNRVNYKG